MKSLFSCPLFILVHNKFPYFSYHTWPRLEGGSGFQVDYKHYYIRLTPKINGNYIGVKARCHLFNPWIKIKTMAPHFIFLGNSRKFIWIGLAMEIQKSKF